MAVTMEPGVEQDPESQAGQASYLSLFIGEDNTEIVPIRWEPQPGIIDPERLLGEGMHTENYHAGDADNPGDFYRVVRLSEEEFIEDGPVRFQENFNKRTEDLIEEALAIHRLNPDGGVTGMAQLLEVGIVEDERVFSGGDDREYVYKDCRVYFRYRGIAGGRSLSAPEANFLTIGERVELLQQAAGVLAEVHARSWIHGDVKPENILWSKDEGGVLRVMLIDFNSVRAGMQLTSDSPLYAATKDCVIVGGRRIVQPRIDVASFGRTVVEFVLGLSFLPHGDEPAHDDDESRRCLDYWLNKAPIEELEGELRQRGYAAIVPLIRYARSMSDADISKRPHSMAEVRDRLKKLARKVGRRCLNRTVILTNFLCGDPEVLLRRAKLRGHIYAPPMGPGAREGFAMFLRHHMRGEEVTFYEFAGRARSTVRRVLACEPAICVFDLRTGFSSRRTDVLDDMAVEALFDPASPAKLEYDCRRRSRWAIREWLRSLRVGLGDYFLQMRFLWHRLSRSRLAGSARVPVKAHRIRGRGR